MPWLSTTIPRRASARGVATCCPRMAWTIKLVIHRHYYKDLFLYHQLADGILRILLKLAQCFSTVISYKYYGRQAAEPGTRFRMLGRRQCREDRVILKVLSTIHNTLSVSVFHAERQRPRGMRGSPRNLDIVAAQGASPRLRPTVD